MKFIRETYRLLRNNIKTLIIFEVIYKVLFVAVSLPLIYVGFQKMLDFEGIRYLADDTLIKMLVHPLTYIALIVVVFVIMFLAMIDISAVISCYHVSYTGKQMKLQFMFYEGFRNAVRLFLPRNILMISAVIIVTFATSIGAAMGYLNGIAVPEIIINYIESRRWIFWIAVIIYAFLILLAFKYIFAIHIFVLEKKNFRESMTRSREMIKGRYVKTSVLNILWQFAMLIAGVLMCAFVTAFSFGIIKLICPADLQYKTAIMAIFIIVNVVFGFMSFISVPLVFTQLSYRYYMYQDKSEADTVSYGVLSSEKRIPVKKVLIIVAAMIVIMNSASVVLTATEKALDNFSLWNHPAVAAHRGSSVYAPENSIPAFEKAISQGVDWIELDVHQTCDGVVVVTHDSDIKRIAGVNKKVYNLSYDELMTYDVGSWFSEEYAGLQVATLDEVIKLCKGKVKLNIELKPTGHEPDFEQHVIDIIRENGIENQCVIASMNPQALRKVKELAPDIQTLYVCYIAAGNVKYIEFADAYSVKAASVSSYLVQTIHGLGKKLFVWTVNDENTVRNMMNLNVDIIITDNPVMVQEVLDYEYIDDRLGDIVDYFFERSEPVKTDDGLSGDNP